MTHVLDALGRIKEYWGSVALADLADYARGVIIRGGAVDYEAYAAETLGAVLIGDGVDVISDTTPTFVGLVTLDAGLEFGGGSGGNVITIPDNLADALHIIDDGAGDIFLRFVTTTGSEEVVFNDGEDDVDFRVAALSTALRCGDPTYAFAVSGQFGTVGMGVAGSSRRHLYVFDDAVDTTASFDGGSFYHQKTAGATDQNDDMRGLYAAMIVNQAGTTVGHLAGLNFLVALVDGTVGTGGANRNVSGITGLVLHGASAVTNGNVEGLHIFMQIDGGTVGGNVYGVYTDVNIADIDDLTGDVYGHWIRIDDDEGADGTVYMLYLDELSGIDYGIYQNGTAQNYLGGPLGVGVVPGTAHNLYVYDNAVNTAATYYGGEFYHQKTLGASDQNDHYYGLVAIIAINQAAGVVGHVIGNDTVARLTQGTLGTAAVGRHLIGFQNIARIDAGTIYGSAYGQAVGVLMGGGALEDDAGAGHVFGIHVSVDLNVGTVDGNVYGGYIILDDDIGAGGTVYMLYLDEQTGVDYGIYQSGAGLNYFGGNTGVGVVPTTHQHLVVQDLTLAPTATYRGIHANHTITDASGATEADDMFGASIFMIMDDADDTIGFLYGLNVGAHLLAGTIGDGQEDIRGMMFTAYMAGGTANRDVYGLYAYANIDAGTIADDVIGSYCRVDIDATVTSIGGNVYGHHIWMDVDKDPVGSVYMLYLEELSGIDYGIYQSGTAVNYFGGNVGIGTPTIPHGGVGSAVLAIEGPNASAAAGPFMQFTTATDDHPLLQILPYQHDFIAIHFDAYYDAAYRSSDVGSNYRILKNADLLRFQYDSGVAQGAILAWNDGLIMNTSGHVYPGGVKTQDLGLPTNEWDDIYYVTVHVGTSRLVRATRMCPVCGTEMSRGTGTTIYRGEEADYAVCFCLNCGNAAVEELNHLPPEREVEKRPPPKMVLENIRVKSAGRNRSVAVDFRYGEDVLDGEGEVIEQAIRNSTRLGEYEFDEFFAMNDKDRLFFLRTLGEREWYSREETRLMQKEAESLKVVARAKVDAWLGRDLLKEMALPN